MNQSSYYKNPEQIQQIVEKIKSFGDQHVLIGVAGIPGIGKTTFCTEVLLVYLHKTKELFSECKNNPYGWLSFVS